MSSLLDAMLGAATAVLAGQPGTLAPYFSPDAAPGRAPTRGALPLAAAIEPVDAAVIVDASLALPGLALTPRVRVVPTAWPFAEVTAATGVELELEAALATTRWLTVDTVVTRAVGDGEAVALAAGVTLAGARGFVTLRARADAALASAGLELVTGGAVRGVDVELAFADAAKLTAAYAW